MSMPVFLTGIEMMKIKKKVLIKSAFILFSAIFILFAMAVYMYAFMLDTYNTNAQEFTGTGEISLTDSYDSDVSRVSDFFDDKDSNRILQETYQQLVQNRKIKYYEVLPQPIEYVGSFEYPLSVVDGDKSVVEQEIDDEKITPIKTLMLNQIYYDSIDLEKKLQAGTGFKKTDYNQHINEVIPVILGNNYKNYFSVNDTFEGYYLGHKKICFKVKGFLKAGEKITLDRNTYLLDEFVLAPVISAGSADSEDFSKLLTLVKCEGYLHYNDRETYESSLAELNKIAANTGFQYSIPNRMLKNKNIMGITLSEAMVLLPIAILFFVISMIFAFQEMKAFVLKTMKRKQGILPYGQVILITSLYMIVLYLWGKYLNQFLFAKHKEILQMGAERAKVVYFILAIMFSVLLCRQQWVRTRE